MTGPVVWVARDEGGDYSAWVGAAPHQIEGGWWGSDEGTCLDSWPFDLLFPDLKPGECRRYRLVPEEEKA